jgi:hypothetical protein
MNQFLKIPASNLAAMTHIILHFDPPLSPILGLHLPYTESERVREEER